MNDELQSKLKQVIQDFRDGNSNLATLILDEILQADISSADTIFDLGIAYAEANRLTEALNIFYCLKTFKNDDVRIPYNMSLIYSLQGKSEDALESLDLVLKLQPDNVEALINKGAIYNENKEYSLALEVLDRAILLNKNYHEAFTNKGNALRELKRYDEAIAHYDKALNLNPDHHEAWTNKGATLHELKRYDEAIAHYDKALSLKSDYHEASWNKSLSLLVQGNFKDGLPLYESRWSANKATEIVNNRSIIKPLWIGEESLRGKTILLYGEQGFGDFIQFSRYAKLVADLGAKVILEVPETLKTLMTSLEGVSQLVVKGEEVPFHDYQCPLMSLPLAFKTDLGSIPSTNRYINIDEESSKVLGWKKDLGRKSTLRIGLVWSGNPLHQNDHKRSIPLKYLLSYLPKQFEYINLQKEVREGDGVTLESAPNIHDFSGSFDDFSDTATLIECMDLIISVDTSVAHLSGALGKKTWVLLPYSADWRWLLNRSDSPWYPSMNLYRQAAPQDWDKVLESVRNDLLALT